MHITKVFAFNAAHNLVHYKGDCERLHGHTYKLEVTLEGTPDGDGLIIDFGDIKSIVQEQVLTKLDHHYLNDIIPQSSAENIATWIWNQLNNHFGVAKLFEIKVYETPESFVTYRGV